MATQGEIIISMSVQIAETLHGFIDGAMGTSESETFNKQMGYVRKEIEKKLDKHAENFKIKKP